MKLLRDEGVSPVDLLQDEEAMNFLLGSGDWENSKFLIVNLVLPKFDVASNLDLNASLQALGVTDAFSPAAADFSPQSRTRAASTFPERTTPRA